MPSHRATRLFICAALARVARVCVCVCVCVCVVVEHSYSAFYNLPNNLPWVLQMVCLQSKVYKDAKHDLLDKVRQPFLPPCVHLLAPCQILHLVHSPLSACHLLCLPPVLLSCPTCIPETLQGERRCLSLRSRCHSAKG